MTYVKTTRTGNFTSSVANPDVHGPNILYLRRGSTCIGTKWIHFPDQTVNIDQLVKTYISNNRNLFTQINDIKYILVVLNVTGTVGILQSTDLQVNENAEIKVFEDLSNVAPLVLVKLTQDGTTGLTGINQLTQNDLEVYNGYGNFTIRGAQGPLGAFGTTGFKGVTGQRGIIGFPGIVGISGDTGTVGSTGLNIVGATGHRGPPGYC